jgi:hypothetical protein
MPKVTVTEQWKAISVLEMGPGISVEALKSNVKNGTAEKGPIRVMLPGSFSWSTFSTKSEAIAAVKVAKTKEKEGSRSSKPQDATIGTDPGDDDTPPVRY